AAAAHGIELFEKLEEARATIKTLQDENHALRKRNTALEAMLEAGGLAQLKKVQPKKLKDAIDGYIANGTGAGDRAKKDYKNLLNAFKGKLKLGDDIELSKIDPAAIID